MFWHCMNFTFCNLSGKEVRILTFLKCTKDQQFLLFTYERCNDDAMEFFFQIHLEASWQSHLLYLRNDKKIIK